LIRIKDLSLFQLKFLFILKMSTRDPASGNSRHLEICFPDTRSATLQTKTFNIVKIGPRVYSLKTKDSVVSLAKTLSFWLQQNFMLDEEDYSKLLQCRSSILSTQHESRSINDSASVQILTEKAITKKSKKKKDKSLATKDTMKKFDLLGDKYQNFSEKNLDCNTNTGTSSKYNIEPFFGNLNKDLNSPVKDSMTHQGIAIKKNSTETLFSVDKQPRASAEIVATVNACVEKDANPFVFPEMVRGDPDSPCFTSDQRNFTNNFLEPINEFRIEERQSLGSCLEVVEFKLEDAKSLGSCLEKSVTNAGGVPVLTPEMSPLVNLPDKSLSKKKKSKGKKSKELSMTNSVVKSKKRKEVKASEKTD
jgi:hypothetical protein